MNDNDENWVFAWGPVVLLSFLAFCGFVGTVAGLLGWGF